MVRPSPTHKSPKEPESRTGVYVMVSPLLTAAEMVMLMFILGAGIAAYVGIFAVPLLTIGNAWMLASGHESKPSGWAMFGAVLLAYPITFVVWVVFTLNFR